MRKFLMAVAVTFTVLPALAQTVHVGIKTDLTFSSISGNGMSCSLQTGYQAGGFAELSLNRKWSLQPELLFSQKTIKRADDFGVYYVNTASSSARQMLKLSYISLPLLVSYKINNFFTVSAGPQYSYLVYDDENLLKGGGDAFKKNDVALVAGLQLNLSPSFRVYTRYNHGLVNVNNIDNRYKWSSRQIQVGVGMHLF